MATATIPLPSVTLSTRILAAIPAMALLLGYLLARESRGKWILEIIALGALEIAILIPTALDANFIPALVNNFLARWPIMSFILGAAFIRDGGWKIVPGVVLMSVSGIIQFAPGSILAP